MRATVHGGGAAENALRYCYLEPLTDGLDGSARNEDSLSRLRMLVAFSERVLAETEADRLLGVVAEAARELTHAREGIAGQGRRGDAFEVGVVSRSGPALPGADGGQLSLGQSTAYARLIGHAASRRVGREECATRAGLQGLSQDGAPFRGLLGVTIPGVPAVTTSAW